MARAWVLVRRGSDRWLAWYAGLPEDVRVEIAFELGAPDRGRGTGGLLGARSATWGHAEDTAWTLVVARATDGVFASAERASGWARDRERHLEVIAHAWMAEDQELAETARWMLARLERRVARWTRAAETWQALRAGWLSDAQLEGELGAPGRV